MVTMNENPADDSHFVVENGLSFLLNVVFGVIDVLIKRNSISRREVVVVLQDLRDGAGSYPSDSRDMTLELIDGALYRLNNGPRGRRPRGRVAPKRARAA
jgi:hypothetical protein